MKAIIFDMDGVIIDSEPIYKEIDKEIFREIGISMGDEELEGYVGTNGRDMWSDIIDKHSLHERFTVKEIWGYHIEKFYNGLSTLEIFHPIEGIIQLMEILKEKDYKMAIASSSHKKIIEYVYNKFDLGRYISEYVDGSSVENGKPNPEIFIKAAASLRVESCDCLVIEDSENGVKAAKAAGMKCVGFNMRNSKHQNLSMADVVISSFNRENINKIMDVINS
ncbi:HAD family hydrolase [Sporosalibacterium faouarense]|uniref:HAD family hydrolase n=1 Tax=Sporosalibacterium faouarense TaxID=516123 RepID=UPI00192CBFF8|nr:HAD-IA family hydrolase [Sporosalibacterium faouarense]